MTQLFLRTPPPSPTPLPVATNHEQFLTSRDNIISFLLRNVLSLCCRFLLHFIPPFKRSNHFSNDREERLHYFDEESKECKPLKSVLDVGEVSIKWSSAKYIGNYLYLASSCVNESDIHRYHMIKKSWQKLPRLSFPEIIQCLCSIGDYVYAISQSSPPEIYTLADNTRQQCRNNLRLFAQEGLDTVAAAVMNSKLYVLHGFPTSQTSSKTCLSAMF